MTQDYLRQLLDYDPEEGLLTWRERPGNATFNTRFAGKVAGSVHAHKSGYRIIRVLLDGRSYGAHRLIWLWMTGEKPPAHIDHIDRNALNNKFSNLRDGTVLNSRNQSMSVRNSSGIVGVCWDKFRNKWRAVASYTDENGVKKQKKIGRFDDIREAEKAVIDFRAAHGYDLGHGISLAPYHQI